MLPRFPLAGMVADGVRHGTLSRLPPDVKAESPGLLVNVCVVALGKIGLPLAVQFARSGMSVAGADISQSVVDSVNAGVPPFPGEANLDAELRAVIASGSLRATTDTVEAVRASTVVVVVVPLVVDDAGKPDFAILHAATSAVARGLQPGTLVIYETTVPVGTTRHRFAPA